MKKAGTETNNKERVSVGCFTLYRQLGLFSRCKEVWTFSVYDEKRFGLI